MRLFHSSDERTTLLQPMMGANRHEGEATDAVGKPVVWLSSQPMLHVKDGRPYRYRYEVETAEDDPDLCEDEAVGDVGDAMLNLFGGGTTAPANRYFYLHRPISVVSAEEWSQERGRYVPLDLAEDR